MASEKYSPLGNELNKQVQKIIESGRNLTFSSITGAAAALLLQTYVAKAESPILVVVESYSTGEDFVRNLEFFAPDIKVDFFPNWDILPYDIQSPDKEVIKWRFQALDRIINQKSKIIVATTSALTQRIMPPEVFKENSFQVIKFEEYPRKDLVKKLVSMGFSKVEMVEEKGEFSARGDILDIFPLTEENPIRLEFFGDDLETIKYFDIESQRSQNEVEQINLYPNSEVLLNRESVSNALSGLQKIKGDTNPQTYQGCVEQLQEYIGFPGIESLLPIFFKETANLLDYFPKQPLIVLDEKEKIEKRALSWFEEVASEYEYSRQQGNPTLDPDQLFLPPKEFWHKLGKFQQLDINPYDFEGKGENISTVDNSALHSLAQSTEQKYQNAAWNALEQLKKWNQDGAPVAIAVPRQSEADKIRQMFEEKNYPVALEADENLQERMNFFRAELPKDHVTIKVFVDPLSTGFRWLDKDGKTKFALVTEEEIFGVKHKRQKAKKSNLKHFLSSLSDLNIGDYVVHIEYGIGKYEGLKKISVGSNESDFMILSYRGGDKVYVPVDKFHMVQKYSGVDEGKPGLQKLGEKSWAKTKARVKAEITDMADELVKIYAKREAKPGISFTANQSQNDEFAMSFKFNETEDQISAIEDVLNDMSKSRPMDRLVCGDVGFGKTEVAMRAAYKAALDGYQVGVLVPTTILAQQHYESFIKRFEEYPITFGMVSRFQTAKEIKKTLADLAEGKIDILIGTHRLLSKDVIFKNLGLLVVDEEQRFGVKHKEKIKEFRADVDVLTLSATPIPRTLHMSLMGVRDLSVISTPPMNRRAIRTRVMKFNDYIIKEAVDRELRRNGQVFFLHNRVETIYHTAQYLNKIMPTVRVAIAHGQMSERELEKVMVGFIHGDYDILLATTIIESGLDIPKANTIIINNAQNFGLSQLYQLRGRVGRSDVQAYSYLMVPQDQVISSVARKRLSVLQELNDLGAGFKIASHDLELRGAGNLLGSQQSGHIAAIGFELYTSMINDAVKELQSAPETRREPLEASEIKLNLGFEAYIPDEFISSTGLRLDAYKSIHSCQNEDELWEYRASLEDRFGKLPEVVVSLFHTMQVKLQATKLDITQIDYNGRSVDISFGENFKPDHQKIMKFMKNKVMMPKIFPDGRIKLTYKAREINDFIKLIHLLQNEIF